MVGKPYRKKQVVNQHERTADAVLIDFQVLFANADQSVTAAVESLPAEIHDFFVQLQKDDSSMSQNRLLQAQKRKMRGLLTNANQAMTASQLSVALTALLRLYLLPAYFAFQTSMEWISSCLADLKSNVQEVDVLRIIQQVAVEVLDQADQQLAAIASLDCTSILAWLPTFAALSLLDREFQWLSSDNFLRYLDIMIRVLTRSASQLGCVDANAVSLSVPELIQWGTSCTECLRNTVTVVKGRKQSLCPVSAALGERLNSLHRLSLSILSHDSLSTKDAYTAAGATVMLMFYFSMVESTAGTMEDTVFDLVSSICRDTAIPWSKLGLAGLDAESRDITAPTSKCALLRGFLNVYDLQTLLFVRDHKSLFLEVVLDSVLYFSVNGSSTSQLYALQSLEVWVNKLSELGKQSANINVVLKQLEISVVAKRLVQVNKVLCASWGHPARQVSHIVPSIYEQLVKSMISLYGCPELTAESSLSNQINVAVVTISSSADLWQALLREALMMPSFHRGKYNAMKILMEHMGAELFFNLQPTIILELVNAMKDRDISASVGSLLCSIVKHLCVAATKPKSASKSVVHVWEKEVIASLTSDNKAWRNNVADYLLPELVKLEAGSTVTVLGSLLAGEEVDGCKLWCVVQLVLNARLSALPLPTDAQEVHKIQQYLAIASNSADDHLRLAALVAMTASLKASAPVSREDFSLFAQALERSLKTSDVDQCSKINRALRNLLVRAKTSEGKDKKDVVEGCNNVGFEEVIDWVLSLVQTHLYPGVTFDREYASLNLLMTLFAVLSEDKDNTLLVKKIDVNMVNNLLNAFLSSWDKSRRTSTDLMTKLPRPWPGYETAAGVHSLILWAKRLAESARLRESDAGAQVLCSLFTVYSMELGWKLFDSDCTTAAVGAEQSMDDFLFFLQSSVEKTLVRLDKIFQAVSANSFTGAELSGEDMETDFSLAHGMLLAIKLCLLTMHKKGFFSAAKMSSRWTARMSKILALTNHALELAMTVVAEAKSDVPFAPQPIASGASNDAMAAMDGTTTTPAYNMAASYVNTNSFATVVDGEGDADGSSAESSLGAKAQRAIVAAWLLVKESTSLLACLVDISPVPSPSDSDAIVLLSAADIEEVGRVLLDALGRLKHMGAIAEAHVALQAVATTLLRYGDKNSQLSRLPLTWLQHLLQRLFSHQQVFILRRSAGFAYSFLSLLRAEPANCTPVLLHTAMTALLQIVERGLLLQGTSVEDEEVWKLSVHALNVTRLILLDGAFGADLDQYIPQTLMLAVNGFTSTQWSVRNSSMMVFSATVQRSISREKNDSGGSSSVVADEFFNRYQALLPFLQEKLAEVTQGYEEGRFDGDTNDSLYPLLLLFAKFRAPMFSARPEDASGAVTAAAMISMQELAQRFLPLIARCRRSKVAYVRQMAARAYSALIPITEAPAYLKQWSTGFDAALRQKDAPRISANEMHGSLAQCVEMLRQIVKHKQQAQDSTNIFFAQIEHTLFSEEANGFVKILQKLIRCFSAFPCAPIHLLLINSFLALKDIVTQPESHLLLDALLVTESKIIVALLLSQQQGDIVAALRDNSYAPWTLREALAIFTNSLLAQNASEFFAYLPLLLHPVSEVREGFGQGILTFISSAAGSVQSLTLLSNFEFIAMVMTGLEQETEPVLLEIFLALIQQIFVHVGSELFVDQFENRLRMITILMNILLKSSNKSGFQYDMQIKSLEMKAGSCLALEALSVLIAPVLLDCITKSTVDTVAVQVCQRWMELVSLAAHEEQPVDLRMSAAKSIEQAGILSSVHKASVGKDDFLQWTFQSLVVAMDLLQDDDDDIRDFINELVCKVHSDAPATSSSSAMSTTTASSTLLDQFVVLTQRFLNTCQTLCQRSFVEACQETLFKKLASYMGDEGRVVALLTSMSAAPLQQAQALSSKIFEAEQANLYLEKLQAGKAIVSILYATGPALSEDLRERVLQHIRSGLAMIQTCISSTSSQDSLMMIGGSSYDFELFHFLYFCNLLLSHQQQDAADVQAIRQEVRNLVAQTAVSTQLHPFLQQQLRSL